MRRDETLIPPKWRSWRLSWKGVLAVMGSTLLISILFDHFGRFDLVRPTVVSMAVIGITAAMKWELSRRVWFWITITSFVALHVALILLVPWTNNWVPAVVTAGFGFVDLYAMLWVLSVVRKFVEQAHEP